MKDPNFDEMSVAQLEDFMQTNDRLVGEVRDQNLRAHKILEAKEGEVRALAIARRGVDFPAGQSMRIDSPIAIGQMSVEAMKELLDNLAAEIARRDGGK